MYYDRTVLDNGIEVLSEHMEGVRSVTLGMWVRVGGRDEAPHEYGLSHFMEHMLFKGTPTRSALDISAEFDAMGAELNAFTSREATCFHARVIDDRLPKAFEILSDMVVRPAFTHETVVPEREVVLEEIARGVDTPDDYVFDLLADAMHPVHPIGRPILGSTDTVAGFDTAELRAYHNAHYTTGNLVVVACGNVDHDRLVELAREHLGELAAGTCIERNLGDSDLRRPLALQTKETEQAHIVFGFPGVAHKDEHRYALSLATAALGGSMSSRLFTEVREKRGLVYSVFSAQQSYLDCGSAFSYAGTRPDNLAECIQVMRLEFAKLADTGLTAEELDRTKELVCGNMVLGLESTRSRMNRLGRLAIGMHPLISIDESIEKYRSATLDDVNAVAREILSVEPTIAVVSPFSADEIEGMVSK